MNIPSRVNPFGYDNSTPPGYMRAEFLESTGAQCITLSGVELDSSVAPIEVKTRHLCTNSSIMGVDHFAITEGSTDPAETLCWGLYRSSTYGLIVFVSDGPGWVFRDDGLVEYGWYDYHIIFENKRLVGIKSDGSRVLRETPDNNAKATELSLFVDKAFGYSLVGRKSYFWLKYGEKVIFNMLPALDPTGTPCMYDTVTGQFFRNEGSGQFTVGLTPAQALNLANLPATGGSLTVSLPLEAAFDDNVNRALEAAAAKGWYIPVQYRESELTTKNIEVDFLESTGTQGIQIHHVFDKNTGLKYVGIVRRSSSWRNGGSAWLDSARRVTMLSAHPINNTIGVNEYGSGYNGEEVAISNTETKTIALYNWLNCKLLQVENSADKEEVYNDLYVGNRTSPAIGVLCKSAANGAASSFEQGMIFEVSVSQDENIEVNAIPAIDSSGVPCMYDTVSGQNFYNANTEEGATPFTVGFDTTEKAAISISKLPATSGGTLTVSLPAEAEDTATWVPAAIEIATNRGWTIVAQYRTN